MPKLTPTLLLRLVTVLRDLYLSSVTGLYVLEVMFSPGFISPSVYL